MKSHGDITICPHLQGSPLSSSHWPTATLVAVIQRVICKSRRWTQAARIPHLDGVKCPPPPPPSMARRKPRKRNISPSSMAPPSPIKSFPLSSRSYLLRKSVLLSVLLLFCVATLCYGASKKMIVSMPSSSSVVYTIEIINEFPHDPMAFTQGLLYNGNDTLFESTGLYGKSSVRQVLLQTGKVEAIHHMDSSYFGEGLTLLGDSLVGVLLYQVTWLKNVGFIYDPRDLKKSKMFVHQMSDGWGLATDGKVLFGSDGTSTLYQLDPQSLKVLGKATVTYKGHEVFYLNELEHINGEVWANVWQLPSSVLQSLISSGNNNIDVLNGIAWDPEKKRLFVTGKLWPKLYEIKLHPVKVPDEASVEKLCMPGRQ
ncbi:hypothetical protein ACLOJK_032208 [Asimina triloba]